MKRLFDSHCHLDSSRFEGEVSEILQRAREAGVERIVSIGAGRGVDSADAALALAGEHPGFVHATVGIHPHDAGMAGEAELAKIAALAARDDVVAIGETGLDFHYDKSPRDDQRRAFREQIRIARRVSKPIVVHTREAPGETLEILREEKAEDSGGIIHCFSEDAAFAREALALGFVASFSGLVTFPGAEAILDAAVRQPREALLVETDAPFLAPAPKRGRRNEPAFVAHTLEAIAAARGDDPEELAAATLSNAARIYGIPLD